MSFGKALIGVWLALVALCAGCDDKSALPPRTEVLVNVQADFGPELAIIEAALMDDHENLAGQKYTFVVSGKLHVPFSFAIVPAPNAPARVLVVLTGKNAAGSVLAQAKVVTTFVQGKALELDLKLQQACRGLVCGPGQTCNASAAPSGSCGPTLDAVTREASVTADAGAPPEIAVRGASVPVEEASVGNRDGGTWLDAPALAADASQPIASTASDSGVPILPVNDSGVAIQPIADCDGTRPCATGYLCRSGMCVSACTQQQCDPNATCALTAAGAAACNCNSGYISMPGTGGSVMCVRDVACQDLGCSPNAVCEMGSDLLRHCRCKDGYTGDGKTCRDIDECANRPCDAHASCLNSEGSYTCVCEAGYTLSGTLCVDQNECQSAPCDRNATCTNIPGSYQCACKVGFDGNGQTCTAHDYCSPNPCQHGGRCAPVGTNHSCDCTSVDYGGQDCESWIDNCALSPCFNGGTCTDLLRSRTCACPRGFQGANCEVNICAQLNCDSQLVCDPVNNRCRSSCYPNCSVGQPCYRSDDCSSHCCQSVTGQTVLGVCC